MNKILLHARQVFPVLFAREDGKRRESPAEITAPQGTKTGELPLKVMVGLTRLLKSIFGIVTQINQQIKN